MSERTRERLTRPEKPRRRAPDRGQVASTSRPTGAPSWAEAEAPPVPRNQRTVERLTERGGTRRSPGGGPKMIGAAGTHRSGRPAARNEVPEVEGPAGTTEAFEREARLAEGRAAGSSGAGGADSSKPTHSSNPIHASEPTHASAPTPSPAPQLGRVVIPDAARLTEPGQMRKTDFLMALEAEVTETAERELAAEGRSAADCPWIPYWFGYYQSRDAAHVVRALVRYAPEAASVTTPEAAIHAVSRRVARSVRASLALGRPEGVPDGVPVEAFDPESPLKPPSGPPVSDPILGSDGAGGPDPARSELELDAGHPLDNATRGRMETALRADLSDVRLHTGARGQTASGRLSARAFAYGTDIGFAPGRYRPGTPLGDALLAHELAHVLQQRPRPGVRAGVESLGAAIPASDGQRARVPAGPATRALEADANRRAVAAMASLSGLGAVDTLTSSATPMPALAAGLRISRCGEAPEIEADKTVGAKKTVEMQPLLVEGVDIDPDPDVEFANTRVYPQANMEVNQRPSKELKKAEIQGVIGEDLEVARKDKSQSQEERDLRAKYGSNTVANTLYVGGFEGCDDPRAEMIPGTRDSMIVMTSARSKATFSHELGHLMGLPHRGGSDDLMTGSGTTDHSVKLNAQEITKIRKSSYAK